MGNGKQITLYLDPDSRSVLETEAKTIGLSLSAYLRAIARFLKMEITLRTPVADLRRQFRLFLQEEVQK